MQFKQFREKMKKDIFSKEEAQIVAFDTPLSTLKLQLHQWMKAGNLIGLKRGLYVFSDSHVDKVEVARRLYSPCYISLEYALNSYGLIPDVPFSVTLINKGKRPKNPY
jgi:predicted transcriptional regulator of viral defense system